MKNIKVASRYAKSLLKIAIEQNTVEDVYKDMQLITTVCSENKELTNLLDSPLIKSDKKQTVLDLIFQKQISKVSHSFIAIIIAKKREGALVDIVNAFIKEYKLHKNITIASVTSAIPLVQTQKDIIIHLLKKQFSTTIELQEIVNKDIIGGMVVKVGDKQIDESIKRKLINLKMTLGNNAYVKAF